MQRMDGLEALYWSWVILLSLTACCCCLFFAIQYFAIGSSTPSDLGCLMMGMCVATLVFFLGGIGTMIAYVILRPDDPASAADEIAAVQSEKFGLYLKTDMAENDRAVYRQVSDEHLNYLYRKDSLWRIGSTLNSSGLKSESGLGSLCPDDAGAWSYYWGEWREASGVQVACILPPWPPKLAPPLQPPPPQTWPLPPWPPGLNPLPLPPAPPFPPGLAPLPPPPWECDWEDWGHSPCHGA